MRVPGRKNSGVCQWHFGEYRQYRLDLQIRQFTPLARYEKGQKHYVVTDTVGRIQELLTEDGSIVWRDRHHFWGQEESANDDTLSYRLRFRGVEDTEFG